MKMDYQILAIFGTPGVKKQVKYALNWTIDIDKFHLSRYVALNSPDLSPLDNIWGVKQQRIYQMLFRNVDELK